MQRINVYRDDDYGPGRRLAGWFDLDAAEVWEPHERTDAPGYGQSGRRLVLTAGGRWVQWYWTRWQGKDDHFEYVSDDDARDALIQWGLDDVVAEHFGKLEAESLPVGRPPVGPQVAVRMPLDMRDAIDAARGDLDRAEWIRRAVDAVLPPAGAYYLAEVTDATPESLEYGDARGWVALDSAGCYIEDATAAQVAMSRLTAERQHTVEYGELLRVVP